MSCSKSALEKFRIIRPFLEEGVPLARIATEQAVSERTLLGGLRNTGKTA
jgi:hypothetical protein